MDGKKQSWQDLRDKCVLEGLKARGKTPGQDRFLAAMRNSTVTICTGPAGTGKTWLSVAHAVERFRNSKKKLVFTRPLAECVGEGSKGLGFLPGSVGEKTAPHMRPLLDALAEQMGTKELAQAVEDERVEFIPLELMRGLSLKGSVVIADEAQNAGFSQLYCLLTRLGEGSEMVVSGDTMRNQRDIRGACALEEVARKLGGHKDIAIVRMGFEDIVRHPLVRFIAERLDEGDEPQARYDNYEASCPSCGAMCYYEDPEDDAEAARCWNCESVMELFDKDGNHVQAVCVRSDDMRMVKTVEKKRG